MGEADCVRLCWKIARGCVKMNTSDYEKFIGDKGSQVRILLIRHGMTQGNKEHRYVGTTDEELLPESVEQLRCMREFWQKQVSMKDGDGILCDGPVLVSNPMVNLSDGPVLVSNPTVNLCEESEKNVIDNLTVYVSPYLRAKQTADILFPDAKQVEIAEFAEFRFGAFEYKNYAELNGNPDYQRFIDSGGTTAFPGGESRAEFTERVMRGFDKMLADVEEKQRLTQDSENWNEPKTRKMLTETESVRSYTIVVVAHGGTIMALMDQLSEPHKDYFDWQVKPGEGVAGILQVNEDSGLLISDTICLKK